MGRDDFTPLEIDRRREEVGGITRREKKRKKGNFILKRAMAFQQLSLPVCVLSLKSPALFGQSCSAQRRDSSQAALVWFGQQEFFKYLHHIPCCSEWQDDDDDDDEGQDRGEGGAQMQRGGEAMVLSQLLGRSSMKIKRKMEGKRKKR